MDEEQSKYLFCFLLNYDVMHIYGTYENLLDTILLSPVAVDLLLMKFYEFMVFNKKSVDEIYTLFSGDNPDNIEHDKQIINQMIEFTKNKEIQFITPTQKMCDNVFKTFGSRLKIFTGDKEIKTHKGYPLPDKDVGRPYLNWCVCTYKDCKKVFTTASGLVNHLIKCNVYTRRFHLEHELAVKNLNMAPDKVKTENITKCMSYICGASFDTPDGVIKHLTVLGIEPFWQKGLDVEKLYFSENNDRSKIFDKSIKIFTDENCVICLDKKPNIISENCRHLVCCIDCFNELYIMQNNKTCPICKQHITNYLPFS